MSDGFRPLEPKNLGHFVDVNPKRADERAFDALKLYIDGLCEKIRVLEEMRDAQSLLMLNLCQQLRERDPEDFVLMSQIEEIEKMIAQM